MAKRPPSNPPAEADLVKATDPTEPSETVVVEPVAMEEPPRTEPEPVDPAPAESEPVEPEPADPEPMGTAEPSTAEPDPAPVIPAQSPSSSSPPVERTGGNGFLGTALGGVVAAAAGYILAIFVPFPGMDSADTPPVATQAEVQALTARIEVLESAPVPDATLADRVASLETAPVQDDRPEQDLAPITDTLTALEGRIADLESRELVVSGEGVPADLVALVDSLRAEVADIQASGAEASAGLEALTAQTQERLAEAEAQAAALRAEAEETARMAVAAAAMSRVQAALESGAPFAGALADMPGVDIPPALGNLAETGVPTRAMLEDAFPPAARLALEASLRADMGEGWSDRLATFLKTTTGARSLIPREGTDPDAVLSRAEAAVRAGDLALALTELQGLPPEGLAEMSEWSAIAQQRLDAIAAAAALSAAVEG